MPAGQVLAAPVLEPDEPAGLVMGQAWANGAAGGFGVLPGLEQTGNDAGGVAVYVRGDPLRDPGKCLSHVI